MIDWDSLGALHLVLLHLPIGLFIGILALELALGHAKHQEAHDKAISVLLPLCLLTSILTVRFGYSLGQKDYNWDAIANHRNAGYVFLGTLTLSLFSFWWSRWRPNIWSGAAYGITLVASLIALLFTGHYGGVITHGENALEDVLPEFMKSSLTKINVTTNNVDVIIVPDTEPANPYTNEAYAILEKSCIECHGINKRKGGYRLDVPRLARVGGESHKPGIVPGDPGASELIHRIMLPREAEGAMPPGKKPALTPAQIDVLRLWIETGAQFPGEEEKAHVKLDPQTVKQLEELRALGWAADFTPWSKDEVLVNLSQTDQPDWELCHAKLEPLAPKLVWLNVANQKWPPEFYANLKDYPQLQRLHLEHSNVTDADLTLLMPLKQLNYLNLTSTQITLNGLKTALTLSAITELFIHDIDLNPKDLKQLRADHPNVNIIGQSSQELEK